MDGGRFDLGERLHHLDQLSAGSCEQDPNAALDADLNPLGPVQELRFTPAGADYACQLSYPAVGPDGVLYVAWDIYSVNTITNDLTLPSPITRSSAPTTRGRHSSDPQDRGSQLNSHGLVLPGTRGGSGQA